MNIKTVKIMASVFCIISIFVSCSVLYIGLQDQTRHGEQTNILMKGFFSDYELIITNGIPNPQDRTVYLFEITWSGDDTPILNSTKAVVSIFIYQLVQNNVTMLYYNTFSKIYWASWINQSLVIDNGVTRWVVSHPYAQLHISSNDASQVYSWIFEVSVVMAIFFGYITMKKYKVKSRHH